MSPAPQQPFGGLRSGADAPLLFEVAWEVCNQLGGIYTVLKTKAPSVMNRWGDNYFLVGPYNQSNAAVEFEEQRPSAFVYSLLQRLKEMGIAAHYGRWLVPGSPQAILIDHSSRFRSLDADKYLLWRDNGLSMEAADDEVNGVVAFGFAVTELLRIAVEFAGRRRVIAHFHEWMAGVALPRIAHLRLPIATVFTTHATLLGRYIASHNSHFYEQLDWINPEEAAKQYNIYPRFLIERAAAHSATCFTTISEVTAREASKFLGRSPDSILPNGLNLHRFTALHEFQNLHATNKARIHEFVMGHFFPSYQFDLDRTLYIFTSGRYEYKNKGMDLFLEALYRLNSRLKEIPEPPTVVSFVITRAWTKNVNVTALQNHLRLQDLGAICSELQSAVGKRLLEAVAAGRLPEYNELLSDDMQASLKRAMYNFRSKALPSVVTHDMGNDAEDPILNHIRHRRLHNEPGDPVKVVFHPDFITPTSPLLNMDYDNFVRGCHLGVFPSYYEPWGYTPPECLALGIPTVTTDLSGFGAFVARNIQDPAEQGVYVLNRASQSPDQSIEDLTEYLFRFVQLSRRERIELRNRAERLTDKFDWNTLVAHYHAAHDEALRRVN